MRLSTLALILIAMALAAFFLGRRRAVAVGRGFAPPQRLHSLPKYYGYYSALWCLLPGLVLLLAWTALSDTVITSRVVESLPEALRGQPEAQLSLTLNDIRNLAAGQMVDESRRAEFAVAADLYNSLRSASQRMLSGLIVAVSFVGFAFAWFRLRPQFRARNHVEFAVKVALIAASMVAILTTLGILLSVAFEAARFFNQGDRMGRAI